jgi:hypothetical protein
VLDRLQTDAPRETVTPGMACALVAAAGAVARLDQALGRHPLLPAFLHRFRLDAIRRQAEVDGHAIDPWHLAAVIEGLRPRMPATRIIDNGMVADAALQALAMHQWLTAPDFDQEGEVQRAERALADTPSNTPVLLAAAQATHRWLDRGEKRPPMRAALVRRWTRTGLMRAPVPLTGARALSADTPWREDLWIAAFLQAIAEEAEHGLALLFEMETAWLAARAAILPRRSTSRAPAAIDLMAATPLISATTLARSVGISVKSAIALLDGFVRDGIAVEVTGRAARRLFGLKALGEEVRRVVRPPYRPEPGRGRGRPPLLPTAPEEATAPPLPALDPVLGRFPAIDYSCLQAAIAHADQVIRDSRRSFSGLARGEGAPASPRSQAAPTLQSECPSDDLPESWPGGNGMDHRE